MTVYASAGAPIYLHMHTCLHARTYARMYACMHAMSVQFFRLRDSVTTQNMDRHASLAIVLILASILLFLFLCTGVRCRTELYQLESAVRHVGEVFHASI